MTDSLTLQLRCRSRLLVFCLLAPQSRSKREEYLCRTVTDGFEVLADDMRAALMRARKPEMKFRVSPIVTVSMSCTCEEQSISEHKRKKGETPCYDMLWL